MPMRSFLFVALLLFGCSRRDGREFDAFLSTNHIDRVEVVDDENDRTNVLSGTATAQLLSRFASTNRRPDPLHSKSYISGYLWMCSGGHRVGAVAYFPREQVLAYRGYEFSFRDTNDIDTLFR